MHRRTDMTETLVTAYEKHECAILQFKSDMCVPSLAAYDDENMNSLCF